MKVAIIGAFGVGNIGDEAMLTTTIEKLRKQSKNVKISVFARAPEKVKRLYGIEAYRPYNLKALFTVDKLILSGGFLYSPKITYLILAFALLCIMLKKKVEFYAVGILDSSFTTNISTIDYLLLRKMFTLVTNHTVSISVRNASSKSFLEKIGVKKPIYVVNDPTFDLKPESSERADEILEREGVKKDRLLVGLSLMKYYWDDQINEKIKFSICQFIDWLAKNFDAEVIFIPMCKHRYFSPQRDQILAEEIHQILKNKDHMKILHGNYMPQEIKAIIKEMGVLIGMRYHAIVFASSMHIPLIAISYAPKINDFLNTINSQAKILDARKLEYESLKESFQTTLKKRRILNHAKND